MLATIAGLGLFEISWWGIRGVFRGFYDPILTYFNRFIHVYTQGTSDIKGSTRKPKTITVYSSNFELINGVNLCKK